MRLIHKIKISWLNLLDNTLFKRLITVLSLDILVKASSFLLLPVYLLLMSQENYGVFNYVLSIAYSFSVILNLGLFIPQSKLYHDFKEGSDRKIFLFNINFLLWAGLLFIVLPVYLLKLDYIAVKLLFGNPINYDKYRFWILTITITSLFSYMLTNYLYTSERIRVISRYNLCRVLVINLVSIGALYLFRDSDSVNIRLMANAGCELVLLMIFFFHYAREMMPKISSSLIMRSLKMGLPIMLANFFSIVINFGDKFFLEKKVGYSELSIYYLGIACAGVISIISASLQNVWLPIFFKEKDLEANLRKTKKLMLRLVLVLTGLSGLIMLGVYICLLWKIFPQNYFAVLKVLPLLLAGQIAVSLAVLYSNYLTYFERTTLFLWAGLGISALSILLNMVLIPKFSLYGAAFTLLVANSAYLLVYYLITTVLKNKKIATQKAD